MTLAKAVLPLLEALDDSDGSIDALQVCSPRRAAPPLPPPPSCSSRMQMLSTAPRRSLAAPSTAQAIVQDEYKVLLEAKLGEMRRAKLGLSAWDDAAKEGLWTSLQSLLTQSGCDYTIFFRQLACISRAEAALVVEKDTSVATSMGEDGEDVREAAATAPADTSVTLSESWAACL